MTDPMKAARAANTATFGVLTAALRHAQSEPKSAEAATAEADFRTMVADALAAAPGQPDAAVFAVARTAMQIVDQLSTQLGVEAGEVVQHFSRTYFDSIADE